MKSMISTCFLLLLMCALISRNYFYINEVADHMLAEAEALPDVGHPDCPDAVHRLADYWQERANRVGLSVSFLQVDRVSEEVALLEAAAECGDLYGYRAALALLIDAIGDMRRPEGPKL